MGEYGKLGILPALLKEKTNLSVEEIETFCKVYGRIFTPDTKKERNILPSLWLAVEEDGQEVATSWHRGFVRFDPANRGNAICSIEDLDQPCCIWIENYLDGEVGRLGRYSHKIYLPKGSISKLTGKEMAWKDDPIKIE